MSQSISWKEVPSPQVQRIQHNRCRRIGDEPSPDSLRGYIERNSIALLSNLERPKVDPLSADWLGRFSNRDLVTRSELWNQRHVAEGYNPGFIETLGQIIDQNPH
jgi:hypothetical protein